MIRKLLLGMLLMGFCSVWAADYVPANYTWSSQSKNSSESMPCGGHDVGMNVWVENGDVLIYLSRSGFFDENNALLKAGRLRLHLEGNPFDKDFQQTLCLDEGCVYVKGGGTTVRLWADVNSPVVYATLNSAKPVAATLSYETWRHKDRVRTKAECQQDSWKWLSPKTIYTTRDSIRAADNSVTFFHQNPQETIFDFTVNYEKLDDIKSQLYNPIGGLRFGGTLTAPGFSYTGTTPGQYASTDYLAYNFSATALKQTTLCVNLDINAPVVQAKNVAAQAARSAKSSRAWWHNYWQRSFITSTTPEAQQVVRNYELFRYMLGCNAYGEWPTKFNGGLFCFDPEYVNPENTFTPDYRCWGGGTMTAQNQRLVYWPMLKSGDTDMMAAQFDTYLRMLQSARARTEYWWKHEGACFFEQTENFGLPNPAEFGKHKEGMDYSRQKNLWLEYLYDTSLEFCQMILLANEYSGMDITKYRPLITDCVKFFDLHYQMLAKQRGGKALDENNRLVIYPGSGVETHKMTYNACSTVAALKTVLETIDRKHGGLTSWGLDSALLSRVPDIPIAYQQTTFGKHYGEPVYERLIAPAETWMRIQNVETTQLYPVFPWRQYGLGMKDLDVARNTYFDDPWALKMRSSKGWKQDCIWAPLVGDVKGAKQLCMEKFADGPYRFPAFWDRGFDWAPDHNRGGAAMIGLEEMLLQERPSVYACTREKPANGEDLMVFPCWPQEWDCTFRLKATGNRTVDASFSNGHVTSISYSQPAAKGKTVTTNVKRPLRVSILGDSYSTYEGFIPEQNEIWYFLPESKGKHRHNDVDRADQTWWFQTIEALDSLAGKLGDYNGARLEKNNSYSGSTVGYTGYIDKKTGKHADYKSRSFITRAPDLGTPDLILICGATNDSWCGEQIGEYKYGDWQEQDLYTFRPAMAKLCHDVQQLYPSARILFILNSELKASINESVHTICNHYNMECLDLKGIDKQGGHPSQRGMRQFAKQVVERLKTHPRPTPLTPSR